LTPFINGIKTNNRIVSLKLSNNEIMGATDSFFIKNLVKDHQSLVSIDFSNNESYQNRNKLGNQGFTALVEGILES
jgi:hypothetical protein